MKPTFTVTMFLVLAAVCSGWTKHYSFRHRDVGAGISGASVPVDVRKADLFDKAAAPRTNRCETTVVTGVKCKSTKTRVIRAKPKSAAPPPKASRSDGYSGAVPEPNFPPGDDVASLSLERKGSADGWKAQGRRPQDLWHIPLRSSPQGPLGGVRVLLRDAARARQKS